MSTSSSALRLVFYGDDFTGSTDALEVLCSVGWRCALFLRQPDANTLARHSELDAIGIAGDSRAMTPLEMNEQLPPVLKWLMNAGAPVVHYKVCSTFDSSPTIGSIGRVIELARPQLAHACVPVVAATPHLARLCVFGHLFARSGTDGMMHRIDRHPIMRAHPVTPMDEADLALHITLQGDFSMAKATLEDVRAGTARLLKCIQTAQHQGAGAIVIDGMNSQDMLNTGEALLAIGQPQQPVFVVGGSGVEHALVSAWSHVPGASRQPPDYARQGVPQVLAVSGSASELSGNQIAHAVANGFMGIALDTLLLLHETQWQTALDAAAVQAVAALNAGSSVVLHTARGPQDPRIAAVSAALAAQHNDVQACRHITGRVLGERLGWLVRRILEVCPLQRLLLSGGDTSSAIARALDVQAIEMAAALSPGAPLCRVLESSIVPGMEIAFKGGQMGGVDFFSLARDAQ